MQGVCRFSRRWHQQFCHSPSFAPHRQCIQGLLPVREYRSATRRVRRPSTTPLASQSLSPNQFAPSELLGHGRDDLVVREFEQHGSDKSSRVQIEPDKELKDETAEVWRELQDVDRQLSVLRQGPFGPQSEFMQQLPADQREEILKALADEGINPQDEQDTLDLAEIDRLMEEDEEDTDVSQELAITLHTPRAHQALVSHFNKALSQAQAGHGDVLKSLALWKWYLRCQQKIPAFSKIISEQVWNFLWESQSSLKVRQSHLVMLARDMQAAGKALQAEQHLDYIQALHAGGESAAAVAAWEDLKSKAFSNRPTEWYSNFYSTGIQIYSSVDRPSEAQTIAFNALHKGAHPKILMHVIASWARAKYPAKAWSVYLKMRTLLGAEMPPELYEKVSDALLDSNHSEMALAVFKDMVARVRESGENTLESYHKALGNTDLTGEPEEVEQAIHQVSLTMLLALPKQYQNKYFFASWIKKLLGQQRIEAASMVVDLMYERGIKPDPTHLNGIIGAWLRDQTPESREKAEKLAWEMIQARINQVADRTHNTAAKSFDSVFRKIVPQNEANNIHLERIHLERPVPPANTETFSLLFDHAEQRHRWSDFERLTSIMLGPAALKPNNFIVNKWLAAELRYRSYSRFWALFYGLEHQITPNLETYALAWQAVASQQGIYSAKSPTSFRQLFASMMAWEARLRSRQRRAAKEEFEDGFYTEVIRSFCYGLDLPGTICAMQGMYAAFKATPNDTVVQLITGQVARMLHRPDSKRPAPGGRRRANARLAADQTVLRDIADIVETLEAKHKIDLVESGHAEPADLEDPETTTAKKMRLAVMTEFVALMMQRTKKEVDNPAKNLRDVAKVMGVDVGHIDMETGLV
ncbi:hypothetical protein H2198_009770 [Neophaeococcomyces mojaviensis]|uniref:Uncharacterized protein n=1 Tax=Neophaeococcomyces mojaviensis TaxID=3383035 RepID=A0ACC2ZTJ5_9EURO|nr:hypothetical protein H2198_009770 [Knufia sp. JES_112]